MRSSSNAHLTPSTKSMFFTRDDNKRLTLSRTPIVGSALDH